MVGLQQHQIPPAAVASQDGTTAGRHRRSPGQRQSRPAV